MSRTARGPWVHWVTLCAGLVLLLAVLGFYAYAASAPATPSHLPASRALGEAREEGPLAQGNASLGERMRRMPPKTVTLAFFGGPDPKWTPRILDLLRERRAHATFFVQGTRVNEQPDLVRRMVAEGHEVAIAGFREPDPTTVSRLRRGLELTLAQGALAGAAGVHTGLFGAPVGVPREAMADIAGDGYVLVTPDRDSGDLPSRPDDHQDQAATTGKLAAELASGAVIRVRDRGSVDADAVRWMLTVLEPQGFRFTTVSEPIAGGPTHSAAGLFSRLLGSFLGVAQRHGGTLIVLLNAGIGLIALLALLRSIMQLGLAHTARRLRAERAADPPPEYAPPVSVLIPAFNESANIANAVRSLVDSDHRAEVEVIVVDDGSTDGTGDIVAALDLPGVTVVRQPNAGKPLALNTGVRYARHEIVIMVDGDTVFEPDTIRQLVQPLADPAVGAVSGNAKVGNRKGVLGRWQHLEYCSGSSLDRQILDALGCITTVPGAVGAFRKAALRAAGGLATATLAEDTDLTIAISRLGWRVTYQPFARAWTEVPSTLGGLYRQRYRWSYGVLQSVWKHRRSLTESGASGRMGRYGLLYVGAFHLLLPLLAPVLDVYVLYGLFLAEAPMAVFIWLAFLLIQTVSAGYALRLDGERLAHLWAYPLQQLVYRQLMYVVVIQSLITAVHGTRLPWQSNVRTGAADRELVNSAARGLPGRR
ncbi:glycosyltransferase [Pseudonocardiaceae bacterium YIM PH 21723]|nr:glycosyltransferase [Pseudonocardiaceae bacterium YIM PH 21723]